LTRNFEDIDQALKTYLDLMKTTNVTDKNPQLELL